jgi:hypothetical protein
VTANVFAQYQKISEKVENGRGMKTTGQLECFLCFAQNSRELQQDFVADLEIRVNRWKILVNCLYGGFAAKTTTGRGEYMTREPRKIDFYFRLEQDIDGVPTFIAWIGLYSGNLILVLEQAFAVQKAHGQFFVVTGRAHGDADGTGINLDFERLFDGDQVLGRFNRVARTPLPCLGLRGGFHAAFSTRTCAL